MRNFNITLLLFVVLFTNCNAQQESLEGSLEIEYTARTRGSSVIIIYKENSLTLRSTSEDKLINLKEEDKKRIHVEVSKIKLSEIKDLKAPTEKRFTDGALSAHFVIKKEGITYVSSDFDHEYPPKELTMLYDTLIAIIKKIQ